MKYNKKNYQNRQWFGAVIAVIILFSCGFVDCVSGMSNPASVYCDELGYKYVVKETADGQRGFCQLPDGSTVDGWKFFTGEEGREYSYCKKHGYEIKTVSGEQCRYSSKCAVCVLKDGTETNALDLMKPDLKPATLPWNPQDLTMGPTDDETNPLFYFVFIIALIVFLVVAFAIYKKIKNRNDYYE
ncbi:MAG: DUF333 domain-containing protein [Patescibacteria group bacterium]|nr:DUF333 domain-containing protein [Patescibacteria group bacterium]